MLSYRLVHADGTVSEGTDTTGAHTGPEALAGWYRNTLPDLAEAAVWAGEPDDRPANVMPLAGVA